MMANFEFVEFSSDYLNNTYAFVKIDHGRIYQCKHNSIENVTDRWLKIFHYSVSNCYLEQKCDYLE